MKRIGQALLSPWFLYPVGALLLSALIWFGPRLVGLDGVVSDLVLLGIIGFIVLLFALLLFLHWRKGRKAEKELVAGIATLDPTTEAITAESKQIEEKLKKALADLRQTLGKGGAALYQLPWYAIIGPPGAGKTTALLNSDLRFPLAEKHGAEPLKGVGGTRNCDWYFTEKAVMLDTAGRWATQDSEAKVDQAAWNNFLVMLKRTRERQPLNGILIAFGVPDLLGMSRDERITHARAVRARLIEMQVAFGLTLPIYVVLTKLDMIAGFVEFFDDLDREGREQVLGLTFPLGSGHKDDLPQNRFPALFDRLIERQRSRLLDRLQSERDLGRRTLIYGFPSQFASLGRVIEELLGETFNDSRFASRLSLRGVYFTSATQLGSPIDRLMESISGKFGIQRQVLPPQVGQGRGFFLRRLFDDVVFNEAGLVGTNPKVERRNAIIRYSAFSVITLILLTLAGLWTWSWWENDSLVKKVEARVRELRPGIEAAAAQKFNPNDSDPKKYLSLLNDLRQLPTGYDHQIPERIRQAPGFGLGQDERLGADTKALYFRGLEALLLPRLMMHAQNKMSQALTRPAPPQPLDKEKADTELFDALKAFLLLAEPGRLSNSSYVDFLTKWYQDEFEKLGYGGDAVRLAAHVKALAGYGQWRPVKPIDEALIRQAQDRLSSMTVASRALKILESDAASKGTPWRVIDAIVVGRENANAILVREGSSLEADAVPFLYTKRGFFDVFYPRAVDITATAHTDAWVLYRDSRDNRPSDYAQLKQELDGTLKTYFDRYARHWDAVLGQVRLKSHTNAEKVAELLENLDPLRSFYSEVSKQTLLVRQDLSREEILNLQGRIITSLRRLFVNLDIWGRVTADYLGTKTLGDQVKFRFQPLQTLAGVTPTNMDPPSGTLLHSLIDKLKRYGNRVRNGGGDELQKVARELDGEAGTITYPPYLQDILKQLAANVRGQGVADSRGEMQNNWSQVFQFCSANIANKFPISQGSNQDIPPEAFIEMFGKGKRVDTFIQSVKRYLNEDASPWQWKEEAAQTYRLPPDLPRMLWQSDQIAKSFLGASQASLQVGFDVVPDADGPDGCKLTVGTAELLLDKNAKPSSMTWPSGAGRDAKATCGSTERPFLGQWAFPRLLNYLGPRKSGGDQQWILKIPGGPDGSAGMKVIFNSDKNPLQIRTILGQFKCVPFQ